jgi:AMP-polyphosphate phosphotransferase
MTHLAAMAGATRRRKRRALSHKAFERLLPQLRYDLLEMQRRLRDAGIPVVVLLAGADGVKSDTANALSSWLDPRGMDTVVFTSALAPDPERPRFAPYFEALPAAGRIGLFCGSWYSPLNSARLQRTISSKRFKFELERIVSFEQMLADSGMLIIKLWLYLDEAAQRSRLKALSENRQTRWKVSKDDWKRLDLYDRYTPVLEEVTSASDAPDARWYMVDAADDDYRNVAVGKIVLASMREALESVAESHQPRPVLMLQPRHNRLETIDLTKRLTLESYERKLPRLQGELRELSRLAFEQKRPAVLVFEGWDAAGKGGSIRRLTEALDARQFRVVPIAAPTAEERTHHYLWRFWRQVPRDGRITIYDRSWYGRVLVERVEGFASESEWQRAFDEINEFELHLVSHGTALAKFWLHLSPEEQLRRFSEREVVPWKQHKITDEDWRNRERWQDYTRAVNDMLALTDRPPGAPWHVIPANDKRYARIAIIEAVCSRLRASLAEPLRRAG